MIIFENFVGIVEAVERLGYPVIGWESIGDPLKYVDRKCN